MRIYVVNGMARSGKTEFESMIKEITERIEPQSEVIVSSIIDYVKDIATYAGWDGSKTKANRKFLAQLKNILTEWNDSPMQEIFGLIEDLQEEENKEHKNFYLFIDMRQPEDIDRLKVYCIENEIEMETILVRRRDVEGENYGNNADDGVFNYTYDYIIENNDGLDKLRESAEWFCEFNMGIGM